jgi:N-acetylglucosamine malate deacetylase 1
MNFFSRRKLLSNTGRLAAAAFVPAFVDANKPDAPVPKRRISNELKVVVAGGHPGDPEYGCGGTIARYTDSGHQVVLLYLNRGEGGSPKLPPGQLGALRTTEAKRACEILKARPAFAGQFDGKPIVDAAHYDEFRKILEAERPDVLFTQWPIDNHPDHRATSMLAYEAWLRMGKSFGFYYYEVSDGEDTQMFSPTIYVDITSVEQRKRAACYAHASQTPDRYYALETEVARFRGIESGHAQAEAFIRHAQSPVGQLPADS